MIVMCDGRQLARRKSSANQPLRISTLAILHTFFSFFFLSCEWIEEHFSMGSEGARDHRSLESGNLTYYSYYFPFDSQFLSLLFQQFSRAAKGDNLPLIVGSFGKISRLSGQRTKLSLVVYSIGLTLMEKRQSDLCDQDPDPLPQPSQLLTSLS